MLMTGGQMVVRWLGVLLLLTFAFRPVFASGTKSMPVEWNSSTGFIGYVPDEIVVRFASGISNAFDPLLMGKGKSGVAVIDEVGRRFNAVRMHRQFPRAKPKKVDGRIIDLAGWHTIKFSGPVPVLEAVRAYKNLPQVVDAQPIGIHAVDAIPNDGRYANQWHMNQATDQDIDAPETWENLKYGIAESRIDLKDIIVAVPDTGVRYFHKDLGGAGASYAAPANTDGNMWVKSAEKSGMPGVDDDGNGLIDDWVGWDFVDGESGCWSGEDCTTADNDPRDFNGHGTHCAGNIAAINNNAYCNTSPAGGWGNGVLESGANGVKVMALRIGWSANDGGAERGYVRMDFAAQALTYASDNGAKIVSCSWGSSNTGGLGAAIDYFLAGGGMIFKAAGNENRTISTSAHEYMCGRSDVICVAATDQNDCKASFSNYGPLVDISAPGVSIDSLYHYHPDPGPDYTALMSGTSMATPLAAGTAALIWAQHPTWTAAQVRAKLQESADNIDSLPCNSSYAGKLGSGRGNLYHATYIDSDGDGFHDWSDGCPDDPAKTDPGACGCGIPDTDGDGDEIPDCQDNCPAMTNPEQTDDDGDTWGNSCDNCPDIYNPEQVDSDYDGIGDACENIHAVPGPAMLLIPLFLILALLGIASIRNHKKTYP